LLQFRLRDLAAFPAAKLCVRKQNWQWR